MVFITHNDNKDNVTIGTLAFNALVAFSTARGSLVGNWENYSLCNKIM